MTENATGEAVRGDLRRGAILVAVGLWLLVSTLGIGGFDYSDSWPLLLVFIGFALVLFPNRCDGRVTGVSLIAWGGLMYVAVHGLWGFNWANVWPLVLVVVGAGITWRALAGRDHRRGERGDA